MGVLGGKYKTAEVDGLQGRRAVLARQRKSTLDGLIAATVLVPFVVAFFIAAFATCAIEGVGYSAVQPETKPAV